MHQKPSRIEPLQCDLLRHRSALIMFVTSGAFSSVFLETLMLNMKFLMLYVSEEEVFIKQKHELKN